MVNCKICGMTDLNTIDDIVNHINAQHRDVGDDIATRKNIDTLVREVATCWQQHTS